MKFVSSLAELASTPWTGGCNALCWPRELVGDFAEVVELLGPGDDLEEVDAARLRSLSVSARGQAAIDVLVEDLRALTALGLAPVLNCVRAYERDERSLPVATDVFSFHIYRAPIETATWLCTYFGPASEVLPNDQAVRRVDLPDVRAALLACFGGDDDVAFREWLSTHFFDLHYAALPRAQPYILGVGALWRLAVDWPRSPVPPCIHRAPATQKGDPPRLLLIC
ncbi:MAG TPA: DUF1826 domain-containing protein [Planctomycetota bacterium]|nr:DUF1826 domain-containing protein [Planctomycetota bacterium]